MTESTEVEAQPETELDEAVDAAVDDGGCREAGDAAPESGRTSSFASADEPTEQELVDEGDLAADYIEELLDIADLDGDIDIDARAGRAYVSVTASGEANLRQLSKPDTVAALQELTRLAVQNRTGRFSRLILDVGGSRDARAAELASLVDHAVDPDRGGRGLGLAAPDVELRAQDRARPGRRARLHLGVRGRGPRPSHRHLAAAESARMFHVKR